MTTPDVTPGGAREAGDTNMGRTYASVFVLWLVVLAALFVFQRYFTH